ncbi:hypothetical protein [Halococcus hamelinensis]|uniref:DUF456 domain-containing protein n=1 Tax=Halococcus hamelinensis 100A6 TaxID=1132509 RepID=M0LZD0_9EURY|nr:hypothetical protein [Halococcus hamelinensis]EMA38806.1 hypothetical protein C447_08288 [Halococcus hamelinensis 100A6]
MADGGGEGTETKTRDVDDLLAEVDDIAGEGDESRGRESSDRAGTTTADPTATTTADPTATTADATRSGTGSTLRQRMGGVFSLKAFVVALVLTAVGSGLGGFIPLIGGPLAFLGLFLATFVLGAIGSRQYYVEAGLAAGLVAGGSALQNHIYLAFVDGSGPVFIAGFAVIGLVCGVLGHYFGRDLRDGLTRDL